ncbi:MAG: sulfatase-like hydrolase/transferase [Candidatus Hydrogenedentes bacterium]|nr:sulfatase-like hydrolase/transferase [Candidatus Hydrogenedentota bacterium]
MINKKISRAHFLKTGLAAGAGMLWSRLPPARADQSKRPNILVVFADDQTYRAIGYNNSLVLTPNLDRLAGEGLILEHAYVASPICVASRASIMTGLFPQQHGSVGLDAAGFQKNVVEDKRFPTLAHVLSSAGYDTAFCGKSHLGDPKLYGFVVGEEHKGFDDTEAFAAARGFLESRKGNDTPFLLWLAARQPHVPLKPAQQWLDLYKDAALKVDPNFREAPPPESICNQGVPGEHYYRDSTFTDNFKNLPSGPPRTEAQIIEFMRAYYAMISHLDHQIGEIMDQLQETGLGDNTIVFYLADNGYHLGNHGLGNKITMHEESVRVPMFVHGAGVNARGQRSKALVSTVDLFPTLADLAGVPSPPGLWGKSLVPLFSDPETALRNYMVSECVGVNGKTGQGHRMVRTDRWKYVLTDTNDEALFDQLADPYELDNAIPNEANVPIAKELRTELMAWMQEVGDTHAPPR